MSDLCVIMSVYKKDKLVYLTLAVDSILRQTYNKFDLYIAVDGAVDQDIETYLNCIKDKRVQVFFRKKNKGLAQSLNDLLNIVLVKNYNFIARMDADDIACTDRFLKQRHFLLENKTIDIVGGHILEIDENNESKNKTVKYPLTHNECFLFFKKRDPVAHPAVMFKKTYFKKAGIYDSNFRKNQDTELWFRGFKNQCHFANIDEVVLKFRISGELFERRGNFNDAFKFFFARIRINYKLSYNLTAYIYAFLYLLLSLSPIWFKKITYKKFR